jgi:hypothetical protein
MSQQDLDDADVHATVEQVRGEAVAERVGPKAGIETTLRPRLEEGGAGRSVGQVSLQTPTGKEPPGTPMGHPDLAEHSQDGFGQRQDAFLVALAEDAEPHLLGIDCRDGQGDGLGDPQAIGVDEGEAAAEDGFFQGGDQAAAVRIATDVG